MAWLPCEGEGYNGWAGLLPPSPLPPFTSTLPNSPRSRINSRHIFPSHIPGEDAVREGGEPLHPGVALLPVTAVSHLGDSGPLVGRYLEGKGGGVVGVREKKELCP